jgi:arylsulfatase A-like enzyme/glucose/arabinose dehydrogenase/azurin
MTSILIPILTVLLLMAGKIAEAAKKPHAVIVVGTHHYSPQKTMPPFAAELERLGMRTTVINPDWDPEKDKRGLPGLEELGQADVALFFTRFLKLDEKQLSHITKYLEAGKPVVGFRTSTHGFNYPSGHPRQELNTSFGRDALGTPYLIHLAGKTQIARVKSAEKHPILTGVDLETWESPGSLYLTKTVSGIKPLLLGTGNSKREGKVTNQFGTHELQKTMTDTVAWTWSNKWGGRTFSTSLGHVGDFANPQSMRVMVNGVFWAAGLDVPSAKTKIQTLSPSAKTTKPAAKPTKKRQQPAKTTKKPSQNQQAGKASLPDTRIKSGGMTVFYGNSMVERLQEEGTFEALLQVANAGVNPQIRSLAYTGDEVGFRIRPEKFGDHLSYVASQLSADRVVMCFGMNEAFAGSFATEAFMKNLEIYLAVIKDRHSEAELFLVSPTAVEPVQVGRFPVATQRNDVIADYCQIIKFVAAKNKIAYIDLFNPSKKLFAESKAQLTINGLHLNTAGNQAIAKLLAGTLASAGKVSAVDMSTPGFQSLRKLTSRKAYEVAMAYKPANGIHYYGVRSRSFEYETEVPHHLRLANLLDAAIWAQASDLNKARPFPKLPTAKAQPPARKPRRGLGVIKTAKDDLADFTVADGFEVNTFASSDHFPELINPLQINFDARGRLWVACFASYPVPVPGKLSTDKILIFEDSDGDGQADKRTVFADNLKLPDGFVFHQDGIIASVARQLVWLRDTDGDDVADVREEMLRGADDTDTHHGGYLARTPQGHVIYCEGLFHRGQFETPYGPVRTKDATALYLDTVTRKLTLQRQTTHPNPWKISYNHWGESMQMFGGGQIIDCDYYDVWTPVGTSSSGNMGMPFRDDKGCTLVWVSSPHFPKEWQGGLVTGHLLSKNAVLYTPLKLEGGTYVKAANSLNLISSPNKVFRPTDLAFGLDGALYVSDFYYPIIGHAQHSIRDENRDYANGRVWRVTRKGAPLAKAPVIAGAPLPNLFNLLTHAQVRVRELVRLELEKRPPNQVVKLARSKVGTKNELLGLELLWLFERAKDYSQTNLFKQLVKSDQPEIRRAAARSLRWWAPALGKEAQSIAAQLAKSDDIRTRMAVVSVASYLQVADKSWREFIDNVDAEPNTPLAKVASLASLYDTPPLKPQFPVLKVDPAANLTGWLMNDSGHGGSLIVKSGKQQDLVLGYRGNAFINLNLNNIPLQRATGSLHTKNGQLNVTLETGLNKIEFYTAVDGRGRPGKADLYLANLIGGQADGLTFAKDAAEHLALTKAYNAENDTVTADRIRLKAVPSKMAFNATKITVKAGHTYRFVFENPDHMLHNLVITKPGKGNVVGEMVDDMAAKPDAMAKHFIPDTDLILFATPQLPYGGMFEKEFTTPKEPGRYRFICTFPGHWRLMSGVMIVEKDALVRQITSRAPIPSHTETKLQTSEGVTIESSATQSGFKTLIPRATRGVKVTANKRTNNDPIATLTDGKLAQRFGPIFGNGITDGAYKMDLGAVQPIGAITSWSHARLGKRGSQRVKLFGSKSTKDPGWNLTDKSKFTALGDIETGPIKTTFTAASLRAEQGETLGSFRWIVWSVSPVTRINENTAFQELAVEIAGDADDKPKVKPRKRSQKVPAAKPHSDGTKRSPNVIIVMTDDQGYGDLACHGNPILKTPNLDRLHGESIRLTDFHVSSFCTPTRAALMTGRYPGRTGAYRTSSGRTMLHTDERTVADVFSDGGYVTGMVGKWHLGDNAPHRPQDRGFQDVVWHRCGGVGQASDFWGNDYFDDTYERNGKFEKFEGYCTDVWFAESIRFVEQNRDKPFFLYIAPNAPHGPYRVDPKWAAPYRKEATWGQGANFYGMIANIDHNVGRLRQRLQDLDLSQNTILIFMTDNGTANGAKFQGLTSEAVQGYNAGMRGKKSSVYEGGHRVPFFIHWPDGGLVGGRDLKSISAHIDVLPTLAELCGLSLPKSHEPDGISFADQLKNLNAPAHRDHLVVQFQGGPYFRGAPMAGEFACVLKDRWRLIDGKELYDLTEDPAQRNDIAAKYPNVVTELGDLYSPFWESVSPRMTPVSIDLGNSDENPTVLCSQDWYMPTGNPPWNFGSIKRLPRVTGPWKVNVKQAGRYRVTLRQLPIEANQPVKAVRAKVQIAGQSKEAPVMPGAKGIVFELNLPAGKTELRTWLFDNKGKAGGAYFTEVEAL